MNSRRRCGCNGEEFDARAALARIAEQQRRLGALIVEHLSDVDGEEGGRARRRGARATLAARIVGGVYTLDYPECCLVGNRDALGRHEWFCTGVLVHERVVLTAGHCNTPHVPINVVALGVSSQGEVESASADVKRVVRRRTHPGYMATGEVNDVTVLILGESARTTPVAVASPSEIAALTEVTLVGFGNADFASTTGFGLKRKVTVPVEAIRRAATDDLDGLELRYGFESDVEFVAGGAGRDACNGDSGGPAYAVGQDGTRKLVGLTSRATADALQPCGGGGVYSRVDAVWPFVRSEAEGLGIHLDVL